MINVCKNNTCKSHACYVMLEYLAKASWSSHLLLFGLLFASVATTSEESGNPSSKCCFRYIFYSTLTLTFDTFDPKIWHVYICPNNNNNNTLIYIAPACRMTSEALQNASMLRAWWKSIWRYHDNIVWDSHTYDHYDGRMFKLKASAVSHTTWWCGITRWSIN